MKEFITAAEEAAGVDDDAVEFTLTKKDREGNVIESQVCKAFRPEGGQVALLMASTQAKHLSEGEMVAGIINFFVEVLDDESHTYIVNRLMDRKDPFGLPHVQEIIRWLMEEWSGRPTQSSLGSTPSPQSDGPMSTPPTPTQTSSVFESTASATSSGPGAPSA